jgi:hypothetical protein
MLRERHQPKWQEKAKSRKEKGTRKLEEEHCDPAFPLFSLLSLFVSPSASSGRFVVLL